MRKMEQLKEGVRCFCSLPSCVCQEMSVSVGGGMVMAAEGRPD